MVENFCSQFFQRPFHIPDSKTWTRRHVTSCYSHNPECAFAINNIWNTEVVQRCQPYYNVCFYFLYNFIPKISHLKKNWARYYHKRTYVSKWSARYSCQILINLEFSRQSFEKHTTIKFQRNPSSGSGAVPRGRTDRQTRWS